MPESPFDDLQTRMAYQLADGENFVLTPDETAAVLLVLEGVRALCKEANLARTDYVFVPDLDELMGTRYGS